MSKYNCENCGKTFKQKPNLDYHTNNAVCTGKTYDCKYCKNKFTSKNAMYRHIRDSCQVKKNDDTQRNEIYERLVKLENNNERLSQLEKSNEDLKKKNKKQEEVTKVILNENKKLKK